MRMASATSAETIPIEIREIARHEMDAASAQLGRVPLRHKNIHRVRRHLKKMRALLRLLRPKLPAAVFGKENRILRDLGRKLAPIRDARVLVRTADALAKASPQARPALTRAIAVWKKREAALQTSKAGIRGCLDRLHLVRRRVDTWPVEMLTRGDLRDGVRETFRLGRRAFRRAAGNPEDKPLHNLRKRVKDLEYHFGIFKSSRTTHAKKACRKIAKLDGTLGEDHDWAILMNQFQRTNFPADAQEIEEILGHIARRRAGLQKVALKLGEKLYSEKPRRFARRTMVYPMKVKRASANISEF